MGLKAGDIVDKYELLQEIGSGAKSVVFKAQDVALHRSVAIKFLLTDALDGAQFLNRFKQEARALGTLEHSNIVKVHEIGATENGAPYIVMNYLNGKTLTETFSLEGKLTPQRWLSIMLQVCTALNHAHSKGIIHRDIKPSNIILANESGGEIVKLIDFGIAKNMADDAALTKHGDAFGTPLYMSPEQCAGVKLDERSDIYSLGCVMYEALAGRAPLVGGNSLGTMQKHLKEAPQPLASVLPSSGADALGKNINSIVMKCLEKKPRDRYQTIDALKEDLSLLFQGEKPLQRPSFGAAQRPTLGASQRPNSDPNRHTIRVVSIAAIAAISIGAAMFLVFQNYQLQNNQTIKVSSKEISSSQSMAPPPIEQQPSPAIEQQSETTSDPALLDEEDRIVLASNKKEMSKIYAKYQIEGKEDNWTAALRYSQEAFDYCQKRGTEPAVISKAYWHRGHAEERLEEYSAAKKDYQLALKAVSGHHDYDSENWRYQALIGLGDVAQANSEFPLAITYYGNAYNIIPKEPNPEDSDSVLKIARHKAMCMKSLGDVYYRLKQFDKCKTNWKASMQFRANPHLAEQLKALEASQQAYQAKFGQSVPDIRQPIPNSR